MKYYLFPILWALFILVLSLMSPPQLPTVKFDYADKLAHAFVYFVLTLSWVWAFLKKIGIKHIPNTTLFKIVASCSLYGGCIEILQYTSNTGRNFEIPDIIANIVGCLFGVFLYQIIKNLST